MTPISRTDDRRRSFHSQSGRYPGWSARKARHVPRRFSVGRNAMPRRFAPAPLAVCRSQVCRACFSGQTFARQAPRHLGLDYGSKSRQNILNTEHSVAESERRRGTVAMTGEVQAERPVQDRSWSLAPIFEPDAQNVSPCSISVEPVRAQPWRTIAADGPPGSFQRTQPTRCEHQRTARCAGSDNEAFDRPRRPNPCAGHRADR
jgi:hypothetical protein